MSYEAEPYGAGGCVYESSCLDESIDPVPFGSLVLEIGWLF